MYIINAKIIKMERLTNRFLIVFLCLISFTVLSQTNSDISQIKVSVNFTNKPIKEVLTELTKKTDYEFIYSTGIFDDQEKVSLNFENTKLDKILLKILSKQNLTYKVKQKQIIILKKDKQSKTIFGKIFDSKKFPLPGVNIVVKGTSKGVISGIDGDFEIELESPESMELIVSSLGFKTQNITIGDRTEFNITLEEDALNLEEVVVVGYGTMKKSDLTASISSVKSDKIDKTVTNDASQALQGRVAGVNVIQTSGSPYSSAQVRVRGIGTLGNTDPLYIIDGSPGNIAYLNQKDIASIEVLKDAAAAAIYGSRAANGVIIVTTKKGKKGETIIEYSSNFSVINSIKKFDLLDSEGYLKLHKMMYENAGKELPSFVSLSPNVNTDWQDQVFRTAYRNNHDVRVRGASENANYSLSASTMDNEGTIIGTDFTKSTIRLNLGFEKKIFKVEAFVNYAETKSDFLKLGLGQVYKISPLIPAKDENGNFGMDHSSLPHHRNPLADNANIDNWQKVQHLNANTNIKLQLTDWLSLRSNLSLVNSNSHTFYHEQVYQKSSKEKNEYIDHSETRSNSRSLLMENWLELKKDFGKHSVNLMGGFTASEKTYEWISGEVEGKKMISFIEDGSIKTKYEKAGFLDTDFKTLNAGEGGTYGASGSESTYKRSSILSRLNYAYNHKYLFQATFRRDGSSKFGKNNRYGNFSSFALGWTISEEDFFKVDAVDFLKLRASYGTLGTEGSLGRYDHQTLITSSNTLSKGYVKGASGTPWLGSIAGKLENRGLKWEESKNLNIGIDFGFLKNFNGNFNIYDRRTDNFLITKVVSLSAGIDNPTVNLGESSNRGFEFELSYNNKFGDLNVDLTSTFSYNQNEITKMASSDQEVKQYVHIIKEGEAIGSLFLYKTDGIFQTDAEVQAHSKMVDGKKVLIQPNAKPGDIRYIDEDGNGKIDADDKSVQGNGLPKYEYGLNVNLDYKGIDLSVFFFGVGGNKIFNANKYFYQQMKSPENHLSSSLDAWTKNNTNTSVPRAVFGDPNNNGLASDRFLEDGDYFRIKTLQLGYTIPTSLINLIGIDRLRVYTSVDNLMTITDYSGLDPEVSSVDGIYAGYDNTTYPTSTTFSFGIDVKF
jgi:TonB-linked SusC/RagA family outer membrane protein